LTSQEDPSVKDATQTPALRDPEVRDPDARESGVREPDAIVPAEPSRPRHGGARPADRAIEISDALTRYMSQLSRYAPISREEEHELAVRWREEGDVDAGRRLVLSNLRLVVKIAMEYRRAWTNTLDLIQEGNLGLMQALQRFDPYQGVKLSSYGVYWIRAYILKYILDNIRIVRVGRSRAERKLFFRLNKEKRELEREGFSPEPKLLAARLDVTEDDVRDMEQRLSQSDLSLNAPLRRDDDSSEYGDSIAAGGQTAEENVGDAELRRVFIEKVHEFAATCGEREQKIIEQRLLAEEPRTLRELGEEFGVSRERVRQLEARLMVRLSDFLKEELVDFDFYTTSGV